MNAIVGTDGKMVSVTVASSPSVDMSEAAVAAVRQWEYTPTLLNCRPIEVPMSVLVAFAWQGCLTGKEPGVQAGGRLAGAFEFQGVFLDVFRVVHAYLRKGGGGLLARSPDPPST